MRKSIKTVVALICMVNIIFLWTCPVMAMDTGNLEGPYYILTSYDEGGTVEDVQVFRHLPKGTYFDYVTAAIVFEKGKAYYSGSVSSQYQPIVFTVELEKDEGGSWDSIASTSETYTEEGINLLEGSYYIVRGKYRSVATGTALRENGTPIKSLQAVSASKTY